MQHDVTSMSLLGRLHDTTDVEAWNRFHEIYGDLIGNWLRRRGVPEDIAEDVRQEVLTKVFEEIRSFNHNGRVGSFRKWLRMVMQHRLRTFQRKAWRQGGAEHPDWSELVDQLADDNSHLTRMWNAEHDAYLVDRLLKVVANQFSEQSLEAFRRVILKNEDVTKVASELGMSSNAVRIAQSRVLASLRRVGEGLVF